MKTINLSILSLFLLVGIKQTNAQTAHKATIEHKEIAPAKEMEVKEAPHMEVVAPQPIQRTEITPVKEVETQPEIVTPPVIPVEEHKAEQVEWVKTEPQPSSAAPTQAPVAHKSMPVFNRQTMPATKRIMVAKPLVIDTSKGK